MAHATAKIPDVVGIDVIDQGSKRLPFFQGEGKIELAGNLKRPADGLGEGIPEAQSRTPKDENHGAIRGDKRVLLQDQRELVPGEAVLDEPFEIPAEAFPVHFPYRYVASQISRAGNAMGRLQRQIIRSKGGRKAWVIAVVAHAAEQVTRRPDILVDP